MDVHQGCWFQRPAERVQRVLNPIEPIAKLKRQRKIALSNPIRVRASSPTLSGRPPSTRRTGYAMGFKIFDFPLSWSVAIGSID